MYKINYNYINVIFNNELNNDSVNSMLTFVNKLKSLLDYIINNCTILPNENYSIKDYTFYNAFNYVKEVHPTYYLELIRMNNENEIHVFASNFDNATCDSYNGHISIYSINAIIDELNLIHEFFHHQNLIPNSNKENITRKLFGETISITAELDFERKLTSELLRMDAKKFEINYINDAIKCAKKVRVELILIDIHIRNNKINNELIKEYILNCNDIYLKQLILEQYEDVLNDIGGWCSNFKFPFNMSYFLGIIIGYYLADIIELNPNIWKLIYDINNNFYNITIEEFLNKLKINLEDEKIINNFMRHYNNLNSLYKEYKLKGAINGKIN